MLVVVCMTAVDTKIIKQAIQSDTLRPIHVAVKPAVPDAMNAPKVIKEEISCWRPEEIFHPIGVAGSFSPNIWIPYQSS